MSNVEPNFQRSDLKPFAGFAAENMTPNPEGTIVERSMLTSDDHLFHLYIENLFGYFISDRAISMDSVRQFVFVQHADSSVDVYFDDLDLKLEVMPKRPVKAGQKVYWNEIGDVRSLSFPRIPLREDDSIACCIKVKWKFGLYFDFSPNAGAKLAPENVYRSLGKLYRYLMFEQVYLNLFDESLTDEMQKDGWFPYVEIVGPDYDSLVRAYKESDRPVLVTPIIGRFDAERIERITSRWWVNAIFAKKRGVIDAGIKSFNQGDQQGDIACIKVLYSEIEGILNSVYKIDVQRRPNLKDSISHARNKASEKAPDEESLLFPDVFFAFLNKSFFAHFDPASDDLSLTRHTVAHGAAELEVYTRQKALQGILVLDQLFYYL